MSGPRHILDELVTKARERVARDIATFEDTAMIKALVDEVERLTATLERVPTNADVDYVLQVYKPETHDETSLAFVYIDSPTVPGLHCGSETAEKALACVPAMVARLRRDNASANCTFAPKTETRSGELQAESGCQSLCATKPEK